MELITIITSICSVTVVSIIGLGHWRQQVKQNKIASTGLLLKWYEEWDKNASFSNMMYKLEDQNAKFTDKNDDVHFVLGKFEMISKLQKDGVLQDDHIREFFGMNIVRINRNKSIRKILDDCYNKDHHNYSNLKDLLKKSKKWWDPYYF